MPAHPFTYVSVLKQSVMYVVSGEFATISPSSGNVTMIVVEWVGLCKTHH